MENKFNCKVCQVDFREEDSLLEHIKEKHEIKEHLNINDKETNIEHKETFQEFLCVGCNSENNITHKCIDCSSRCCQPCKNKKKGLELTVKNCLNLSLEANQFICKKCITKRCKDQQKLAQRQMAH